MANKNDKLKSSFGGGSRRKKKSLPIAPDSIEETTGKIYPKEKVDLPPPPPVAEKPKPVERGRPTKRNKDDYRKTSFDIHKDLYELMEIHLFKNRKTIKSMKDYILGFVKEDLGWTDPDEEQ